MDIPHLMHMYVSRNYCVQKNIQ